MYKKKSFQTRLFHLNVSARVGISVSISTNMDHIGETDISVLNSPSAHGCYYKQELGYRPIYIGYGKTTSVILISVKLHGVYNR